MSNSTGEARGVHAGGTSTRNTPPTRRAIRKRRRRIARGVLTLARWRVHDTWGLLLVTGLGIVIAVMLACAVPLFSDISMTSGLRGIITVSYQSEDVQVQSLSATVAKSNIDLALQQVDAEFQKKLGPYLKPLEFSLSLPAMPFYMQHPTPCSANEKKPPYNSCDQVSFIAATSGQARSHLRLLQGRLPLDNEFDGNTLEIALSQESADYLHVAVGSLLTTGFGYGAFQQTHLLEYLPLRVVGIFALDKGDDPYWHGNSYQSVARGTVFTPGKVVPALASNAMLLSYFEQAFTDPALATRQLDAPLVLQWYYPLNPVRITINQLDRILGNVLSTQVDIGNNPSLNQSPYVMQTTVILPSDILQRYHDRIAVAQVPVVSLLIFVLGIVLLFVSMMADFLVERQSDSISTLRSRGASRLQIFGTFSVQAVALGLVAFVLGSALAVALVIVVAQATLSISLQDILSILSVDPGATALNLGSYALISVLVSVVAMVAAVYRSMQFDVLAQRREAARSKRRPLWQRVHLDLVATLIAFVGFGISYYVTNSGVLDPQLRLLLLSPLTLLQTVFILIACLLLFLRLFQLLLRLGAWLVGRGRGASSMLALAQMARSPRQALRVALLFSLAAAFVIFTLIFDATQAQRIPQVAAFQSGADFSGVPDDNGLVSAALDETTASYRTIPGLASVTLGYKGDMTGAGNVLGYTIEVAAVDARTFAYTAGSNWTKQDAAQSLSSLMAILNARRASVQSNNFIIPAIVDENAAQSLHLTLNEQFALNFDPFGPLTNQVVAIVQRIPTISDSVSGGGDVPVGGVLVDYKSLETAYNSVLQSNYSLPINYVWVRARDDPASIASVRKTLTSGCCFTLHSLLDRRQMVSDMQNDPLSLDLFGILATGATIAMLLALIGSLIASWLSVRQRLTSFAVLRALGASPRQLAAAIGWEQGIIYLISMLLGLLFGMLLSLLSLPALIFTSIPATGAISSTTSSSFFVLQNVPPIQIVIPLALLLVLGVLVAICVIALILMIWLASRPSISQALRINED